MQQEVTFAGFGGQGVMTAGKFLAQAAMNKGLEVVWIPSYGPEMRGGTAYCTVVISDKPVASPIVNYPQNIVVMNRPSLQKFDSQVKEGGILIINSSLIPETSSRTDIKQVQVPCNQISIDVMGTSRSANIAVLGALIGANEMLSYEEVKDVMVKKFAKKPKVLEMNVEIFKRGYEYAKKEVEKLNNK